MAAFPISRPPSDKYFSWSIHKRQLRTPFESGTVQSVSAVTKSREVFEIGWDAITNTELTSLHTFFNTYQGATFTWTHPTSGTSYTVRFSEDSLPKAKYVGHLDSAIAWEIGPIQIEEA